jgi:amino acid adenylation domain-containing protein
MNDPLAQGTRVSRAADLEHRMEFNESARWFHSICVSVPYSPDCDGIAGAVRKLATAIPGDGETRLWVEKVQGDAGGAVAERRRRLEMRRFATAGRHWRAVLLTYDAGGGDLIIAADRRLLSRRSLHAVADAVLRGGGGPAYAKESPAKNIDRGIENYDQRVAAVSREWGVGKEPDSVPVRRVVRSRQDGAPVDPAALVASTGVVLARFRRDINVRVAVLGACDDHVDPKLQPDAPAFALPISFEDDPTFATLIRTLRRQIGVDGAPPSPGAGSWEDCHVAVLLGGAGREGSGAWECREELSCASPLCPLTIAVERGPDGGRRLAFTYDTRAICDTLAASFADAVEHMLDVSLRAPATRQSAAGLLGDGETETPARRGGEAGSTNHDWRIDDKVEDVAAANPGRVAISDRGRHIRYGELVDDATAMADGLTALGVTAGAFVGVALPQSSDLIATLLAVLKTGAAYVPIDPASPPQRYLFTLADAGVRVLVAEAPPSGIPADVRVVRPSDLRIAAGKRNRTPPRKRSADDPAYVIYTSGTTGRPKGVIIPHRNVAALVRATAPMLSLSADDRWTAFHSSAFDFSVWEIWGCLTTGARLVLVPFIVSRSPEDFHRLLLVEGVSVLSQTPSAFYQLLTADKSREKLADLRLVIFGGEPLDVRRLQPWIRRYAPSRCRLVNMFGITETTVHVTAQTLGLAEILSGSRSVGLPLPGWWLSIRDRYGHDVPCGVMGEVYVGGDGVAVGYLGLPELTNERFLPDRRTGGRVYRSGDLGRLWPDGRLDHLGRCDNQVKIRGHRVELDEIREVLLQYPDVTDCAVVARKDERVEDASMRIDAYVVLSSGAEPMIRQRLARTLPEYMLPASIVEVPALPLNLNGKIDVAALPAPTIQTPIALANGAANGVERLLADAFAEVLGRSARETENFFNIGGNSLLAVKLVRLLRERGVVGIGVTDIYKQQTPRALAAQARLAAAH